MSPLPQLACRPGLGRVVQVLCVLLLVWCAELPVAHAQTVPGAEADMVPLPPPKPVRLKKPKADAPKHKFGPGLSVIPFGGYSSDLGVEVGVLGSFYWFANGIQPYALRVDGLLFTSTRLQSYYFVSWDAPSVLGSRLRLGGRLGLANALSENYCGMAFDADCNTKRSSAAADRFLGHEKLTGHGLDLDPARDELARKYYWYRLVAPTVGITARYKLTKTFLLFGRYDLTYYIPSPYPVSLLKEEMPFGARQGGPSSVPQIGLVYDTRDFEPAPTFGTFSEVSLRASSNLLGSGYNWLGFNTTIRLYVPMIPSRKLVFATRFIADIIVGPAPFYEQSAFGGTDTLDGVGGERGGRGMRFQRYRGKGRFLWTPEFRATVWSTTVPIIFLGNTDFDFGGVVFMDVGKVIGEWPELTFSSTGWNVHERDHHAFTELVFGVGTGLRLAINKLFIIKFDIAMSPSEREPGVYLNVGHVF